MAPLTCRLMSKPARHSLRLLRQASGLTLRELARQVGVQASNLSLWERTGKLPRADMILPLAAALGVSPEEILGGEKPAHGRVPMGRLREVVEQLQGLPRAEQDKIIDVVEALLAKARRDR